MRRKMRKAWTNGQATGLTGSGAPPLRDGDSTRIALLLRLVGAAAWSRAAHCCFRLAATRSHSDA
jgi:hypothetical protein